jgi:hypothetical protein
MNRLIGMAGVTLLLLASVLAAADVSGKWTGEVPGRGGQGAAATFVFKADGDKLTGTMTGPQGEAALQEGKVSGDEISFSMQGNNAKILFKGTVSGDQIKMTRTREGGEGREFTLKRAQ